LSKNSLLKMSSTSCDNPVPRTMPDTSHLSPAVKSGLIELGLLSEDPNAPPATWEKSVEVTQKIIDSLHNRAAYIRVLLGEPGYARPPVRQLPENPTESDRARRLMQLVDDARAVKLENIRLDTKFAWRQCRLAAEKLAAEKLRYISVHAMAAAENSRRNRLRAKLDAANLKGEQLQQEYEELKRKIKLYEAAERDGRMPKQLEQPKADEPKEEEPTEEERVKPTDEPGDSLEQQDKNQQKKKKKRSRRQNNHKNK
ncbi:hypothetical protein BOX15_Mlig006558g3, partial [Macrostomum lignano]